MKKIEMLNQMLKDVSENTPIFVKRDNVLIGMLVNEDPVDGPRGWILRTGGRRGATGHHETREKCIESIQSLYICEFFIEEEEKRINKRIKILETITEDMEEDAKAFDGRPFNGHTVAEYFGNQGAAIAALSNIIKSLLNPSTKEEK